MKNTPPDLQAQFTTVYRHQKRKTFSQALNMPAPTTPAANPSATGAVSPVPQPKTLAAQTQFQDLSRCQKEITCSLNAAHNNVTLAAPLPITVGRTQTWLRQELLAVGCPTASNTMIRTKQRETVIFTPSAQFPATKVAEQIMALLPWIMEKLGVPQRTYDTQLGLTAQHISHRMPISGWEDRTEFTKAVQYTWHRETNTTAMPVRCLKSHASRQTTKSNGDFVSCCSYHPIRRGTQNR